MEDGSGIMPPTARLPPLMVMTMDAVQGGAQPATIVVAGSISRLVLFKVIMPCALLSGCQRCPSVPAKLTVDFLQQSIHLSSSISNALAIPHVCSRTFTAF